MKIGTKHLSKYLKEGSLSQTKGCPKCAFIALYDKNYKSLSTDYARNH